MGSGQFIKISDCTCPEDIITYNCIISGPGFTIWQGNAFDCLSQGDVIPWSHTSFGNNINATKQCSGGAIVGREVGVSEGNIYTSQLSVTASSNLIGRTVECVHRTVSGNDNTIGSATIELTG